MTDRSLDHLHPDLKPLAEAWLAACAEAGLRVSIIFTWRSVAEQDGLYALGRTVKSHVGPWTPTRPLGSVVTNAKGNQSKHTFTLPGNIPASKAFDFAVFDASARYITDGGDPRYTQAGVIGEGLGMKWGGRWPKPKTDWDHFEIA